MSEQISILIIDDDRIVRQILQSSLSRKDFVVYTTEDGPLGIDLAQKEDIDVILLDWMMPVMDGMEVLRQLKQNDKTKQIPVFMLTNKGARGDIDQAISAGIDDYIVKPFNASKIGITIRNKLQKLREANTSKRKSSFKSFFSKKT
jgi:DNA-binding response OmpR family regulator